MTLPDPVFEAECIRRILAGEKHLFHELIRPCERSIYFLLLSLLKNETDAEDAAQETVIKVYQNLDKFRGDAQFRTWVLSIARNEGLGRLRKIGSRREDSLDAADGIETSGDYTPAILDELEGDSGRGIWSRKNWERSCGGAIEGIAGDLP